MTYDPRRHYLWPEFERFARVNGIDLEYREDWQAWWECFIAGAVAEGSNRVKKDRE